MSAIDDEEPTPGHETSEYADARFGAKLPPDDEPYEPEQEASITRIRRWAVHTLIAVALLSVTAMGVYAAVNRSPSTMPPPISPQTSFGLESAKVPSGLQKVELRTTATEAMPSLHDDAPPSAYDALPVTHERVPPISSVYPSREEMQREADLYDRDHPTAYTGRKPVKDSEDDCAPGEADMPHMDLVALKNGLRGASEHGESEPSLPIDQALQMPAMPQSVPGGNQLAQLAAALGGGSRDDVDDKEKFLGRDGIQTRSSMDERAMSPCFLTAGWEVNVNLLVATNSDLPSGNTVTATVTKTVWCGDQVAIPQGASFSGEVNPRASYGQNRQQLCMKQLNLPPSASFPLGSYQPLGCQIVGDISGQPGMEADVDNHWAAVITGGILTALLSLGTTASMGNQQGFAATTAQNAAHSAGNSINQSGQTIVNREMRRPPTLTTHALTGVVIRFTDNLERNPWNQRPRKRRHL